MHSKMLEKVLNIFCNKSTASVCFNSYKNLSQSVTSTGYNYQNRTKILDLSFETEQLHKVVPEIKKEILDEQLHYHGEYPDLRERYSKLLDYNVFDLAPRNISRGLFSLHAYRLVEKPSRLTEDNLKKACILGWCHKMIDASILIDDDIADVTNLRYNKPTWFKVDGVGVDNAILDGAFLESACHFLILNHLSKHPQYSNIQREILRSYACTNIAQMVEIKKYKLEELEKYQNFIKFHAMTQPIVGCALYLANIDDKDAYKASKEICLSIAHYQKVDDDVKGMMTPFSDNLKECTDISEGRTSWLGVEAYKKSNEVQRKLLREHYGKNNKESVAICYNLFKELRLNEAFEDLREEFYEKMFFKIHNELPKILPPQLYIDLLDFAMSGKYLV